MQIKPEILFIPDRELENRAGALLARYDKEIAPILAPPVPVERIADFLLELGIEWIPIPDADKTPILGYIRPNSKTIRMNATRRAFFDKYFGTMEYTLAHEVGHYELHLTDDCMEQLAFDTTQEKVVLCREKGRGNDRKEWQAERFASFLLMPSQLLRPALDGVDLLSWPTLYRLRDKFCVSIQALKIRLEDLGLLYIAPDGRLFHSEAEASGQLSLF